MLPLASLAASGPAEASPRHLLAAIPYAIGAVICHQQPARSFHLWSRQLPVCARCTGIYLGAAMAALVAGFRIRSRDSSFGIRFRLSAFRIPSPQSRAPADARLVLIVAALPTLATLAYQWSTADTPSNAIRALAGIPLGAAAASVFLTVVDDRVN